MAPVYFAFAQLFVSKSRLNLNEFYLVENESDTNCTNIPPDDNYILDNTSKEFRICSPSCNGCFGLPNNINGTNCVQCNNLDGYFLSKNVLKQHLPREREFLIKKK